MNTNVSASVLSKGLLLARGEKLFLSLLRLPVPPLRENCIENSMSGGTGKAGGGKGNR
jgi:hypothetical protein